MDPSSNRRLLDETSELRQQDRSTNNATGSLQWTDLKDIGVTKITSDDGQSFEIFSEGSSPFTLTTKGLEDIMVYKEIFGLKSLTELQLSGHSINTLPSSIGNLENLVSLNLKNTNLPELPSEIWNLSKLKVLNLSFTDLQHLPPEIERLSCLESLDFVTPTSNEDLPESIVRLTNLKILATHGGPSSVIGNLRSLEELRLAGLSGDELPDWIGNLKNLTSLQVDAIARDDTIFKLSDSIGSLEHLESLYLQCETLQILPASIWNLKNLSLLLLQSNNLLELPDSIGNLEALRYLQIECNSLERLPDSIGNLQKLYILVLISERVRVLPDSIGNLKSLQTLDITGRDLERLPDTIGNIKSLTSLLLGPCSICTLPNSIGNLESLKQLSIDSRDLDCLPNTIGKIKSLTSLFLAQCSIRSLPNSIGNLRCLECLKLWHLDLETLPHSIGDLKNLKQIDIVGLQSMTLPIEMAGLTNLTTLLIDEQAMLTLPLSSFKEMAGLKYLTVVRPIDIPSEDQGEASKEFLFDLVQESPSLSSVLSVSKSDMHRERFIYEPPGHADSVSRHYVGKKRKRFTYELACNKVRSVVGFHKSKFRRSGNWPLYLANATHPFIGSLSTGSDVVLQSDAIHVSKSEAIHQFLIEGRGSFLEVALNRNERTAS